MKIAFVLNNQEIELESPPLARFLDVLRRDLKLTAAKEGCGEGECGSCSILLDGEVVNSCLLPVVQVAGRQVETLEAMVGGEDQLNLLQECMLTCDGAQCGICTPGMVVTGTAFLRRLEGKGVEVRPQDVRTEIAGNLCRCTGYDKIVDAIMMASRDQQSAGSKP